MKIFAVSDLHTDFIDNWKHLQSVTDDSFKDELLIIAGDIADKLETIETTLEFLKGKFKYVSYVPGNHEMWIRKSKIDSIEKFNKILNICQDLDVITKPVNFNNVWIVPLYSWYVTSNINEKIKEDKYLSFWMDFHLCKWGEKEESVAEYFLEINQKSIRSVKGKVISFSHFLPTEKLLPDLSYSKFKGLRYVSVCPGLMEQINQIGSFIHIYGHTHINRESFIGNTKYIQNAFRYPRERRNNKFEFKMIYETKEKD